MFGGGADREFEDGNGTKGEEHAYGVQTEDENEKEKGEGFKKEDWGNEKTFGSTLQCRKTKRLLVLVFRASNFCADASLNNTHLQDKTKMKIRQNNHI